MTRLMLFLGSMIGSTLAFVFVVVALVVGIKTLWPLIGAGVAGFLVSWPIAYVAQQSSGRARTHHSGRGANGA